MKGSSLMVLAGATVLFIFLGSGCFKQPHHDPGDLDQQLALEITSHSLTGDPRAGQSLAEIDTPLAQLGMKLFFSKSLSLGRDTACVSCHHPFLGGGDALPLPIGVEAVHADILGRGRTHEGGIFTVPRNSPTIFNSGLWQYTMFADGRIEVLDVGMEGDHRVILAIRTPDSDFGEADPKAGQTLLEAQARFPVTSVEEMRGTTTEFLDDVRNDRHEVRRHLEERLASKWIDEFRRVFPEAKEPVVTYANIAKAIGAYEESQLFIDNPWRDYIQGNSLAITDSAKRGALLFYQGTDQGGAGCVSCHRGDFFSDEQYHALCIPQVGVGKGDGATGTADFGRFRETERVEDRHAFRTPSLLNIEVTGPYGHSGFYASLKEVVRHHLSPAKAIARCNFDNLEPMLAGEEAEKNTRDVLDDLEQNRALGLPVIAEVSLTEEQLGDVVNFLQTLTDPCVKDRECLKPWVLPLDQKGPDGSFLSPIDQWGQPL